MQEMEDVAEGMAALQGMYERLGYREMRMRTSRGLAMLVHLPAQHTGDCWFFVHGNGFCKEMWQPVEEEMLALRQKGEGGKGRNLPVLCRMDLRGHGESADMREEDVEGKQRTFLSQAEDCIEVVEELRGVMAAEGQRWQLHGIGHSMGAAILLMAELLYSYTFASLSMADPIFFSAAHDKGRRGNSADLLAKTRRRRWSFPSKEAAREYFRTRRGFRAWDRREVELLAEHGTRPSGKDDASVCLSCDPEREARNFECRTSIDLWYTHLRQLRHRRPLLPIFLLVTSPFMPPGYGDLFSLALMAYETMAAPADIHTPVELENWVLKEMAAGNHSVCPPRSLVQELRERCGYPFVLEEVQGSHLYPFEAPRTLARSITSFLVAQQAGESLTARL